MKKRIIIGTGLLVILIIALAGGFTILWRFLIFLVITLLLSYWWPRLSIRKVNGNVENTPYSCQVGEVISQIFTVSNRSRLPTPLIEVQEDTNLPGYRNEITFNLPSKNTYTWRTEVRCQNRGRYHLGSFSAKVTDPLGFFPVSCQLGQQQDIIVYPAMVNLPFFQVLPRQEPGRSPRRWLASEVSPNASRVREYTSGDSLRHIHWQTTAHTGRLMVKEFDPDRSHYTFKNIWIVLDMNRAVQHGEGEESTEEYGITVAASLAKKYLDSGKRVGLIASGDQSYMFFPDTGDDHLQRLLRALTSLRATGNVPVESLLLLDKERFESGSAVIVIMPSGNQEIVSPLHRSISQGAVVTAILLDSRSFGGETDTSVMTWNFNTAGINVYTIKCGMDLVRALDSREFTSQIEYSEERY